MSNNSPALQAGLTRLSYDLGRIIDTPAQAKARAAQESAQALNWVPCPHCLAGKGQRCRTAAGKPAAKAHRARYAEARAASV